MLQLLKYISKKAYTKFLCLVLSIVLVATVPSAYAEAAVVAKGIDVAKTEAEPGTIIPTKTPLISNPVGDQRLFFKKRCPKETLFK